MHGCIALPRETRCKLTKLFFSLTLAICTLISTRASALQSVENLPTSPDVNQVITAGIDLEKNGRWQEAIQHYEKAVRSHLESPDLQRRLQISRIHSDVIRRYADTTFLDAIDKLPIDVASDLYSEVLTKLDLNYVEQIDLMRIVRNGTAFLEVALTEQDFIKHNLKSVAPDKIEHFRANIHKVVLARQIRSRAEAKSLVLTVAGLAQKELGLAPTVTIHEYVAGAVGLLDPYSGYLTPGELGEMMSQIEGNLIGLGVELWAERSELKIVDVFPGGPAFEGGLKPGDYILAVDNSRTDQIGAKRAADLLRGVENSQVTLLIKRNDKDNHQLTVTRRRVEVPSVSSSDIVDAQSGVGYIKISNFQKTTPAEFDLAFSNLASRGMRTLIIDLRRNPGGLLDAAVDLADRFISQGSIVTTRGRSGFENRNYFAQVPQTLDIPLVVLIDSDSASASEIFAGAIRDHARGTLVGQTSYGKGSVQGLFHTDTTSGGLRITVSKFYSPSGKQISNLGVAPDVVLTPVEVAKPIVGTEGTSLIKLESEEQDLGLRKAIEIARDATKIARKPN
jgi:carboxyl-terminal processing protease